MSMQSLRTMRETDVRDDYQRHVWWTFAETAAYMGRSYRWARRFATTPIHGCLPWKLASVGPYRVDGASAKAFHVTGEAQGQVAVVG